MKSKFFIGFLLIFNKLNSNTIDQMAIYKEQLEFCDQLKDPKTIAACKNNILLLIAAQSQQTNNQEQSPKDNESDNVINQNQSNNKKNDDNNTKEILLNFSNVLTNIGKIAANKNNPACIGEIIFNVMASMVNIAANVAKD